MPLRAIARVAIVAGAAGSVGLMLHVGYRNDASMPFILLIFFTVWVLSPFVGFLLFDLAPKRRSVRHPAALHGVMLLLAIVSLATYGLVAFGTPRPKPAAVFLLVPLGSWVVFTIVAVIAGSRSGSG